MTAEKPLYLGATSVRLVLGFLRIYERRVHGIATIGGTTDERSDLVEQNRSDNFRIVGHTEVISRPNRPPIGCPTPAKPRNQKLNWYQSLIVFSLAAVKR